MKIDLHKIPIRELVKDYVNSDEEGVQGYGGKLDIRPKYQREFVYKDEQRNAVIDTIRQDFPLNVMYWVKNSEDSFEVLDGQQRSISICEYVQNNFSIEYKMFGNLTKDEQEQILNYELRVYFCEGSDSEKLKWFKVVNIAGAVLTKQELRNAVYTGSWLTNAKAYFSKTSCAAYLIGGQYLNGAAIRQEYLETALDWIWRTETIQTTDGIKPLESIEDYMAKHQHDPDALPLWSYFQSLITWVGGKFSNYRKEMKGIDWGFLYNTFKDKPLDAAALEKEIARLMKDDDVSNKKGIYAYVLDDDERHLNIRVFTDNMKREAYERQQGNCNKCHKHFKYEAMEGDHIDPWHSGGKTNSGNCQMLCQPCNRRKSGK
jgi:hypothetical protein